MMSTPVSVSSLVCSVVQGQYLAVQTKGGGNTLLPAVSSLTLNFLPIHTLTGTAAITAQRLQTAQDYVNWPNKKQPVNMHHSLTLLTDLNCERVQTLNCVTMS